MAAFTRFLFIISLLGLIHESVTAEQCNGPRQLPILNKMLQGHIYDKRQTRSGYAECLHVCRGEDVCQSFNFVISERACEFNNRTKEACPPEDFVPDPDRYYVKLDVSRVPLGSIRELPAKSCREINANEGRKMPSDKYWFYSSIPGKSVLDYCDMATELHESTILSNKKYWVQLTTYLAPVVKSSDRSRFVRCWHAKTDGWKAKTFHANCNRKGATVTIIQVGSYIFGGYSEKPWGSTGSCGHVSSSEAFIYSLVNIHGYNPVKLVVKKGHEGNAMYECSTYGPTFGGGHDIFISNNAASGQGSSYTYCGYTYPLPPKYSNGGSQCTFYAGSYQFTPTDVEVFYETTT